MKSPPVSEGSLRGTKPRIGPQAGDRGGWGRAERPRWGAETAWGGPRGEDAVGAEAAWGGPRGEAAIGGGDRVGWAARRGRDRGRRPRVVGRRGARGTG